VRRYVKLAQSRGVDEILAVATSATREADNGQQFVEALVQHTGLRPRVISGLEEARLIFLAVHRSLELGARRTLVVDVGGGNVKLIVGQHGRSLHTDSLRLGVARLLARAGEAGPLTPARVSELKEYIGGVLHVAVRHAQSLGFEQVVGTSGTLRSVGEAAHLSAQGSPWKTLNAQTVSRSALEALAGELVAMTPEERGNVDRVGEQRADTVHLGALLGAELLRLLDAETLTLCDASLREGVLWDYLDRHPAAEQGVRLIADPRRRSVVELARRHGSDDPRGHHVAHLALTLFDQTQAWHGLGATERELLEYAALLCAVGQAIGYAEHERHSAYIIEHSAPHAFTPAEIGALALIVRYHRGAAPKKKHAAFAALGKAERRAVRVTAGLLRLAVALDHGLTQQVTRIDVVEPTPGEAATMRIDGSGDLGLELRTAQSEVGPLERALGRPLRIELGASRPLLAGVDGTDRPAEPLEAASGTPVSEDPDQSAGERA
jgi:exopolyphosphatase/guanosine-5'-triphosphate,3'-diphosphate pyrophosphatase